MHGRLFWSAISCARRCFFTVSGKYVPPLTVASLQTITHSVPETRPMPVMMLGARGVAVVQAVRREGRELEERRARIEEPLDAIAR